MMLMLMRAHLLCVGLVYMVHLVYKELAQVIVVAHLHACICVLGAGR